MSAGDTVSGTLIGLDGVNVNAGTIEAALLSHNVNANGDVTSSEIGFSVGTAANATSQSQSVETAAKPTALAADADTGDDDQHRREGRGARPRRDQFTGRVTVLPQR